MSRLLAQTMSLADFVGDEAEEDEFEDVLNQLDQLFTGVKSVDSLNQAALDWIYGEGEAVAVLACLDELDCHLLVQLLEEGQECLPEGLETLQRQLLIVRHSLREQDAESLCMGLLCLGHEIASWKEE